MSKKSALSTFKLGKKKSKNKFQFRSCWNKCQIQTSKHWKKAKQRLYFFLVNSILGEFSLYMYIYIWMFVYNKVKVMDDYTTPIRYVWMMRFHWYRANSNKSWAWSEVISAQVVSWGEPFESLHYLIQMVLTNVKCIQFIFFYLKLRRKKWKLYGASREKEFWGICF